MSGSCKWVESMINLMTLCQSVRDRASGNMGIERHWTHELHLPAARENPSQLLVMGHGVMALPLETKAKSCGKHFPRQKQPLWKTWFWQRKYLRKTWFWKGKNCAEDFVVLTGKSLWKTCVFTRESNLASFRDVSREDHPAIVWGTQGIKVPQSIGTTWKRPRLWSPAC